MSGLLWQVWGSSSDGYWAQRHWGTYSQRGPVRFPTEAQAREWATPPRHRRLGL